MLYIMREKITKLGKICLIEKDRFGLDHLIVVSFKLCRIASCEKIRSIREMNKSYLILIIFSFYGCSNMSGSTYLDTPEYATPDNGNPTMVPLTIQVEPRYVIETSGVVYDLAWSPDEDILASSGFGRVNFWDGKSGLLVDYLLLGDGSIWDLEWTEDGERLAITGDTNSSSIWEKETGSFSQIPVQLGIKSASWSPDGKQLSIGLCVKRFEVFDLESQKLTISGQTIHGVWGIDWSPDGEMISTAEFDGYIKVWDAETGELLRTYHSGWMGTNANSVAWSPNGNFLASGHRDGRVRIWAFDSEEDGPVQILEKQRGWVSTVVWSPDGRLLVSTYGFGETDDYQYDSDNGQITEGAAYIWDMRSGTILAVLEDSGPLPIWSASWSPDGRFIALGNGVYGDKVGNSKITVWEVLE